MTAYESTEHLPAPDGDDGDGTGLQWDRSEPDELSSASMFGAAAATAAGGAKAADTSGGWGAPAAGTAKGHHHQNRVTPEPSAGGPTAEGRAATAVAAMPGSPAAVAGAVGAVFGASIVRSPSGALASGIDEPVHVAPVILRSASISSSRAPPALV